MTTQDAGVVQPRVRLRVVLALLRVLAGRRGFASVAWHGAGFSYRLVATRGAGDDLDVDVDQDPDAPGGPDARELLRERLRAQP